MQEDLKMRTVDRKPNDRGTVAALFFEEDDTWETVEPQLADIPYHFAKKWWCVIADYTTGTMMLFTKENIQAFLERRANRKRS